MPLAATPKLLTTICSAAMARSGRNITATRKITNRKPRCAIERITPPRHRHFLWAAARRRLLSGTLRHAAMESMVDGDKQHTHRCCEQHDQQRHSHNKLDILQSNRAHQQITETALRAEHLAKY